MSLFIIITITAPGLQVNDEWITVNQLHQLSQGHQVLTNEGKYGTILGEMNEYFSNRHNILGYSLLLPLSGLIPLYIIQLFGDTFRLAVIIAWVTIPVLISALIQVFFPDKSKWRGIPILFPGIVLSLILLYLNIIWYYPFSSTFETAPIESAALVLADHVFFAITSVILFLIGMIIVQKKGMALLFPIVIMACSSYIFWGTNAKDHMITTMLIALVLLFFIQYSIELFKKWAITGFFCCGLLMWARPEVGFTLFIFLGIYYLLQELKHYQSEKYPLKKCIPILLIPCIFLVGCLPFCMNNYLLTENPLYPPYLQYEPSLTNIKPDEIINQETVLQNNATSTVKSSSFNFERIFVLISKYYSYNGNDILTDLGKIFFLPDNGSIGLLILSPIFFISLLTLPAIISSQHQNISESEIRIILLNFFVILAIIFAYLRSLQGLPISEGIGPDMRYLSSIYIPGGILGLMSMKYWKINPLNSISRKKLVLLLTVGSPCLMVMLLMSQPFGGGFANFTFFFTISIFLLVFLFILQYLGIELGWHNRTLLRTNFFLLLLFPLSWQLMLVFLYSVAKFNGYPFWLPFTEIIFSSFIIPVS
ncbi:MAG: hypothetical protein CVV33_00310 [Methanomicrobiales archaeon HGW-Methanomicrobiales-4]|nr:MAG: hypothetical protein CVV33_00310 [Methanomicrobiales archaeon HGW-Methanomicrobiales-4]